jgi:hypothetical protein
MGFSRAHFGANALGVKSNYIFVNPNSSRNRVFNPTSISGLLLWAEPDVFRNTVTQSVVNTGLVVSAVSSSDGSVAKIWRSDGNTAGMPAWRGNGPANRPALWFDGSQNSVQNVLNGPTPTTAWTLAVRVNSKITGTVIVFLTDAGVTLPGAIGFNTGVGGIYVYDGATSLATSLNIQLNTDYFVVLVANGNSFDLYVNGTKNSGTLNATKISLNTISWGYKPAVTVFKGSQNLWLIYNKALTASEVASLNTYAMSPTYPLPAPAKTQIYLQTGNSLAFGQDASQPISDIINQSFDTSKHYTFNSAISGQPTSYFLTNYDKYIGNYICDPTQTGVTTFVDFIEGENDLVATNDSTTSYNNLVAIATSASNLGAKVVLQTITPRSGTAAYDAGVNYETNRLATNALLRDNRSNLFTLADAGADPIMGSSASLTNLTYYALDSDGNGTARVHYTNTGQTVVAPYHVTSLKYLGFDSVTFNPKSVNGLAAWYDAGQGIVGGSPNFSGSNDFTAASWVKGFSTITADQTTDPNGTNTADLMLDNAVSTNHNISIVPANAYTGPVTASVYVKAGTKQGIVLGLNPGGAWFNLANGTITTTNGGAGASITAVTGGWYLCAVSHSANNGGGFGITMLSSSTSTPATTGYAGDGAGSLYLWGASFSQPSISISSWADQSGNGRNLLQSVASAKPVLNTTLVNNKPAIVFNNSTTYLSGTLGASFNAPLTMFTVVKFNQLNQAASDFDTALQVGTLAAANNGATIARNAVDNKYYTSDGLSIFTGSVLTGQTWQVIASVHNSGSLPYHRAFLNNNQMGGVMDDPAPIVTNGAINIGKHRTTSGFDGHWLDGAVAETIIYNRALTTAEITQVNQYLGSKYGVTIS